MLARVFVNKTIEVGRQRAGHCGRATGARAGGEAMHPLVGKALHPFAQRGIGNMERVGDGWEALPFDDVAHRLGTAEDASLFRLFQENISSGEGVIGKVEFEGAHERGLQSKVLQKCTNMASNIM